MCNENLLTEAQKRIVQKIVVETPESRERRDLQELGNDELEILPRDYRSTI